MASTYSTSLKLELQATGENAGTWGDKTATSGTFTIQFPAFTASAAILRVT